MHRRYAALLPVLMCAIVFSACGAPAVPATPTTVPTITATPSPQFTATATSIPTITQMPTPRPLPSLTPLGPEESGKGHLHGKIVYECSGRPVTTTWYAVVFDSDAPMSSTIARVDEKGEFWVMNLTPGTYEIQTTEILNVVFAKKGDLVEIQANQTAEMTFDVIVCPKMKLLSPAEGDVIDNHYPSFAWEAYGAGARYVVIIDGDLDGLPGGPSGATGEAVADVNYRFSGISFESGAFQWRVCVLNPEAYGYLACSLPGTFTIQSP